LHEAAAKNERSGDFIEVASQEWLDPAWHYRLRLPPAYRGEAGPPVGGRLDMLQLLARYGRPDVGAGIEVSATTLEREVAAADWLACAPMLGGRELVDGSEVDDGHGRAAVDVTWQDRDERWCGRVVCRKSGDRMFVLESSVPVRERDGAERELFGVLDSFEPALPPKEEFAEALRSHGSDKPVHWRTSLPASWIFEPGSEGDEAASFQAENRRQRVGEGDELVGKLAFAVLSRAMGATAREVAELYLSALRDHGLAVGAPTIDPRPARRPYLGIWQMVGQVWRDELPGELRCAVLCHPDAWILAGLVGLQREDSAEAWMQNKRALELCAFGTRIQR
jgi:hypothetical protein